MLTSYQRQRFGLLQDKKQNDTLNEVELAEWNQFVQRIEAEEAVYLRPSTERIQQETALIDAQNRELKALIQRKERLARRLEKALARFSAEREAINAELAQILAAPTSHASIGQ